jgi:hypothetical protein
MIDKDMLAAIPFFCLIRQDLANPIGREKARGKQQVGREGLKWGEKGREEGEWKSRCVPNRVSDLC